ncbi:hypothetical protein PTSG_10960 [Salpingoeca rosetta]|uniref:Solute carrier family 25 member 44 n=1 Tax=Salpingoeca rosetta (strain ATCC 50818 / BSB-021) TaxID=946362 RepID=F2USA8_SALR5|nr:uncharacterized protein PTSG_10960 [Salpingoeca rosetta]EGD81017.1 hypothetical protein PTSG_10960 [Salpingoeca rosetta]|eukprot:XP_004987887.1 hypothetical protein PTSG_10960 [Salpingoeca rosetta]
MGRDDSSSTPEPAARWISTPPGHHRPQGAYTHTAAILAHVQRQRALAAAVAETTETTTTNSSSSSSGGGGSSDAQRHGAGAAVDSDGKALSKTFQPAVIDWEHIDKTRFYTLAPLAGILTRIILYPTTLVKTRLQVQKQRSFYNGTVDAFRKIIKYEGVRALYKGFMPNLLNVGAGQVYITSYEGLKDQLQPFISSEFSRNLLGGGLASMVSQTIVVPVNVVSQRLMVHGQSITMGERMEPLTARALVRQIYSSQGLRGFMKGYWASVAAFGPSSGLWWASYGVIRRWQSGTEAVRQGTYTIALQALAGAMAGAITAVTTNPLDVVRARLQVEGRAGDKRGWATIFGELWKEEGVRGLFKGVSARVFYMGFNSLLMITTYETVKRLSLREDAVTEQDVALEACS